MASKHISITSRTEFVCSDKPLDSRTREEISRDNGASHRPQHRDIVEHTVDGTTIYHILPEEEHN